MAISETLFQQASAVLPGGVTAAARVNKMLGRPIFFRRGAGSRLWDVDGNEYIDLCTGFGATLLGHGHPAIVDAVKAAADLGFMCAMENEYQASMAQKLVKTIPAMEMVRYTLSGTETTYYAIKVARSYTGRTKVLKFEGHFHGFNDYLAYNYWPPLDQAWPKKVPAAAGMPEEIGKETLVLPFNDAEKLEQLIKARGHEIAAVILEPINYNSGGILPLPGYLELMRRLTSEYGIVLIFDEILSGFRTGPGCAQAYLKITPDLCTIGKAIGGGTVLSAYGGKRDIMSRVAPLGTAQHSGTYNAHLIPMMAGNAFMDVIMQPDAFAPLLQRSQRLYAGMDAMFQRLGVQARVQGTGARFSILFGPIAEKQPLINYCDTGRNDFDIAYRFFANCVRNGVYMHTMWHHGLSFAHTDQDVALVLERMETALRQTKAEAPAQSKPVGAAPF
jgi:glutamate-1-semialdehyde 2,1-aminomutase